MKDRINLKALIIIILFIIYLFIFLPFVLIKFYIEKDSTINKEVNYFLKILSEDIANERLDNNTLTLLPKDSICTIWIKDKNQQWIPIIRNNDFPDDFNNSPLKKPHSLRDKIRIYPTMSLDYDYIIWIYSFNLRIILQYIILPMLISFLILLMLLFVTIIILNKFPEYNYMLDDDKQQVNKNPFFKQTNEPLNYDLTEEELSALFKDK